MIKQVKFVSIPVSDQQRSLEFYRDRLGFEVVNDVPFMDDQRWIELLPPGAQTRIVLFTADEHRDRIGTPSPVVFASEDVRKTYEECVGRGVKFTQPPADYPWGTAAMFEDPDGNTFLLSSSYPAQD